MDWGGGGAEAEAERAKRMVMIEQQAKEELEIMEEQHPNRFQYLKLELRSFISLLQIESQKTPHLQYDFLLPIPNPSASVPDTTTLLTQESSTRKKGGSLKRKKGGSLKRQITAKEKLERAADDGCCGGNQKRREGVDAAIEKAKACLHKIQQFKTSF